MSTPLRLHVLTAWEGRLERWTHDAIARPYWRIYWNRDPGWTVLWGGDELPLGPGRVLLVAPETVYRTHSTRPSRHLFVHVTCDGLGHEPHGIWNFPRTPGLRALVDAVAAAHNEALPAIALLTHLLAHLPHPAAAPAFSAPVQVACQRLAGDSAVANHQLARGAGMHANAFIRRFRRETGLTPQAWRTRRRIEAACLALEATSDSIDAIAERFGFCDRHHFSRVFSRWRSIGPAAYRKQARPER